MATASQTSAPAGRAADGAGLPNGGAGAGAAKPPKRARRGAPPPEAGDHYRAADLPDLPGFRPAATLRSHTAEVVVARLSGDDARVATASADATARVFDTPTGRHLFALTGAGGKPAHAKGVSDVAWQASGGHLLATASDDFLVRLFDARTGRLVEGGALKPGEGHVHYVTSVAWAPCGNLLASGSFDETARIWDVRRRGCVRAIPAHADSVYSVDWRCGASEEPLLLTASLDGTARIWVASTGECVRTLQLAPTLAAAAGGAAGGAAAAPPPGAPPAPQPIPFARFTPNSRFVLLGSLESELQLHAYGGVPPGPGAKLADQVRMARRYTHRHVARRLALGAAVYVDAAGVSLVVAGSEDHHAYAYTGKGAVGGCAGVLRGRPREARGPGGHTDAVFGVEASRAQALIVTASADNTAILWRGGGGGGGGSA
jgi:WD40 repeat protein